MEIYSKLINKEIEEVISLCSQSSVKDSLKILWNVFKGLEGDREFLELKQKIKFDGFKIQFDIRSVIYGEVEEYYDSNNVRIRGYEKIELREYWDELEEREDSMKDIIREQYDEGMQKEEADKEYD